MSLSKPEKLEKRKRYRAIMGFYLEVPGEQKLYGVTCHHVTKTADSILYIERKSKDLIKFGRVLERRSLLPTDSNRKEILNKDALKPPDIDAFEINANFATLCRSVYRNRYGKIVKCRLFTGEVESLYGKTVFQCRVEEDTELKKRTFKANTGVVFSGDEHQQYKECINLNADFLIRGAPEKFADEGDSGRIVAIEVDENNIEIVGIITAGEFTSPDGKNDSSVCLCILLSKGIEFLNKEYCKEFILHVTPNHSLEINRQFEPGQMILFHRPEDTKPTDFILSERLLMLIDVLKIRINDAPSLEVIVLFETELNEKVYQRKDIEDLEYSTPDQACIQQALISCSKIYSGDLEHAEKYLKEACRMISSKSSFPLRLLCRVFCYTTWLMIEMEKLEEVGPLLEHGIDYMEKHKHFYVFPQDCLGYQYYDHSRYLQTKSNKESISFAKSRALQAINVIEEDKELNGGHAEILALAHANYAHLLLECGEHFEGECIYVAENDIEKAETYLHKAETTKSGEYSVENIYIEKTWGELYFRKKDYTTAERYFKSGFDKAQHMHLTKESKLCQERVGKIHTYLKRKTLKILDFHWYF